MPGRVRIKDKSILPTTKAKSRPPGEKRKIDMAAKASKARAK